LGAKLDEQYRTLYRPVGLEEMRLILKSDQREFPPRLPEQPFFYPVLNYEYAEQIARDWNTKDVNSGYAGFITEFNVSEVFIRQFEEHQVGGKIHRELWIPTDMLNEFNKHIQRRIELRDAYYGNGYKGVKHWYKDWYADEMFISFYLLMYYSGMDFNGEVFMNRHAILLNYKYWITRDFSEHMTDDQKIECLKRIRDLWRLKNPDTHLVGSEFPL
jgi:hypothetical protein